MIFEDGKIYYAYVSRNVYYSGMEKQVNFEFGELYGIFDSVEELEKVRAGNFWGTMIKLQAVVTDHMIKFNKIEE